MTVTDTRLVLPPERTIPDLRAVIEDAIANNPRTLQKELGPSEIGIGCDRCLAHMLAGHDALETGTPWLPYIGNAVHDAHEEIVLRHMSRTGTDRYIPEGRVAVGKLRGVDITGHSDLLDVHTGTVVDYKIVGKTTLDKVRRGGASMTYRRQAHLYGRGWTAHGYDVRSVAIWFLPRNHISLDGGIVWQEPYDEQVALDALHRANQLASFVDNFGVEAALNATGPHTQDEFTCGRWPGDTPPAIAADINRQLDGLIPVATATPPAH